MSDDYFIKNEKKWKKKISQKSYESDPDGRKKFFIAFPFPYVNGALHLGHGYTLARHDVLARFKRLQNYNVLFPFAFHATGEPILGVAERLKKGDEAQIRALELSGVKKSDLKKFHNPVYIARYWQKRITEDVQNFGISVDLRRKFATIDPDFNQFVTWQYLRLKEKGYVIQGTHPVVYCPHDKSPTGDHDRLKGEGEYPVEYTLLKFKFGGEFIIAATLRPETVFGQTNLWVRTDVDYVKAKVNDETWIISEECAQKLKDQLFKVEIISKIKGSELVNQKAIAPMIHKEILILPARFVDTDIGTGIVTSVPSDSPYDYITLRDLNSNIEPVKIINTKQYGDFTAKSVCDKLSIANQNDKEKLEQATSEVYKVGFHTGIMNSNCGKYAGMPVSEAKERVKEELLKTGEAGIMYELSGPVVCRCSTSCIVKTLENQWFLNFGDARWKEKVREHLAKMSIIPDEARTQFEATINWLKEKACARKSGLGTPLPWDKEWIVETLSDSTIYMAFYTIKNAINKYKIKPAQLTPSVFDYIFLKEKMPKTTIPKKALEEMRSEFEYYYGVDMRGSAKELVPNHLTFYIFHHVAVWSDKKYWPKAISANGMLKVEGEKMSKSKGNFITLKEGVEKYSADIARLVIMDSAEGLADPNFFVVGINAWKKNLMNLQKIINADKKKAKKIDRRPIDSWFMSRLMSNILRASEHMNRMETRSALLYGFYNLVNDYEFYRRHTKEVSKEIFENFTDFIAKFMSCFAPFFSQQLWYSLGEKGFVHEKNFTAVDRKLINSEIESLYQFESDVISDIRRIITIVNRRPKRIILVVADDWKYKLISIVRKLLDGKDKEIIKKAIEASANKEQASKIVPMLVKDPSKVPVVTISKKNEEELLENSKKFIEKEFDCKIKIEQESKSKHEKAKNAMPRKPAIIIE